MKESTFQKKIIDTIKAKYPGAIVLKNDANYLQGIPDLLVIFRSKYLFIECKVSGTASHQPNQDYYVNYVNSVGGYACFMYPEIFEEKMAEIDLYLSDA